MNIGNLTRKARKTRTIKILKDQTNSKLKGVARRADVISIFDEPDSLLVHTTIRRRGSEAATV